MHHLWAFVLILLLTVTLAWYQWLLGVVGLLLAVAVGVYSVMAERAFRRDLKVYLGTLSYRVKKAGHEVISELPFGIILYNEDKTVEWHNAFVTHMLERESVVGESLDDLFPTLSQAKEREGTVEAAIGGSVYELMFRFN
jgi:c-di-AMP phosphodiesterase-like protein